MKERCPYCDEKMMLDEEGDEIYCPICGYSEPTVPPTLGIKVADRVKTGDKAGG